MLHYVTVFDPSQSDGEEDVHKQLLLYYSFQDLEITLNEKLGRIGMIQGIWSLTDTLRSSREGQEKVIELGNELILTIKVESRFFISVCISTENSEFNPPIPPELYLSHLWICYQIFTLHYGPFSRFEDMKELTDLLNEQIVLFWNDIHLKQETIVRRGLSGLWPDAYKVSELEFASNVESWESLINQNVLLEAENYMAIKDVLVYHLPSYNDLRRVSRDRNLGYKTYGLIRHFSNDLEMVTQLSNWIYHLHAVHGDLSSHVLAGNAHYEEVSSSHDEADAPTDSHGLVDSPHPTGVSTLQEHGKAFLHNLTLPISFAYDAVQEVGNTTGIAKSMSLIMDYVPRWNGNTPQHKNTEDYQRSRYGYLISPLCAKRLPMSYKVKRVMYESSDGQLKSYNLLFWYYDDVLVVTVCQPDFDKIWQSQYLEDLSYKFREAITRLYETAFQRSTSNVKGPSKRETFAYASYNKATKEIKSSIPAWFDTRDHRRDSSPMKLVINGMDQLFGLNSGGSTEIDPSNRSVWGLDIMGGLLGLNGNETSQTAPVDHAHLNKRYENFLDGMAQEKLWGMQVQTIQFVTSIKASNTAHGFVEERLFKLNNGLLCYIKDDHTKVSMVVRNWFDHREDFENHKSLSDFGKVSA